MRKRLSPAEARSAKGPCVTKHELQAESEAYGAASFLMIVHMLRYLAGRDARARKIWRQVIELAAKDAEQLGDEFGRETAALIRRLLVMKPLMDTQRKN